MRVSRRLTLQNQALLQTQAVIRCGSNDPHYTARPPSFAVWNAANHNCHSRRYLKTHPKRHILPRQVDHRGNRSRYRKSHVAHANRACAAGRSGGGARRSVGFGGAAGQGRGARRILLSRARLGLNSLGPRSGPDRRSKTLCAERGSAGMRILPQAEVCACNTLFVPRPFNLLRRATFRILLDLVGIAVNAQRYRHRLRRQCRRTMAVQGTKKNPPIGGFLQSAYEPQAALRRSAAIPAKAAPRRASMPGSGAPLMGL